MNKRILNYLLLLLIVYSYWGCSAKKDELSWQDVLTSKKWKRGIVDKNTVTNPVSDIKQILYRAVPSCEQDDILSFGNDGILSINNGNSKCGNEDQVDSLYYSYDKLNKLLIIDGVQYKIAEMSPSQIKYYSNASLTSTGYQYVVYLLQ